MLLGGGGGRGWGGLLGVALSTLCVSGFRSFVFARRPLSLWNGVVVYVYGTYSYVQQVH
jgi:hypothetical protein